MRFPPAVLDSRDLAVKRFGNTLALSNISASLHPVTPQQSSGPPAINRVGLVEIGLTGSLVAEALTLVKAGGGDPASARKVLLGGFSQNRILEVQGERMIRRDFAPGGQIKNQIKDLDTILAGHLPYPDT